MNNAPLEACPIRGCHEFGDYRGRPISAENFEEDYSENIDAEELPRRFGQEDHVRWYGREGFVERLKEAGFRVQEETYSSRLAQEMVSSHVLRPNEIIFVATKP